MACMKSPNLREMEGMISIDLVEAALAHRQFLGLVDENPCLYTGPHVENAVRRYELFWLPLLAQHPSVDLAAPLDIAWVWHVHMLSPLSYERDCNEIVSVLVDHRILVGKAREKGLKKSRALWNQEYPREPFEVDLNAPVTFVQDFESRIQYDIKSACQRQRVFYYQVSLPHYADKTFLREAVKRYKHHLLFKQKNQDAFLVPCYDFDLIWHAHQVNPLVYRHDTFKLLGRVLNHDDSVNDRQPGSKLFSSELSTRDTWKAAGISFEVNGAMFRGEPPIGNIINPDLAEYSSMVSLLYTVDLLRVEVEGLPNSKSYTVQIDVINGKRVIKKKVKGPIARIHGSKAVAKFTFSTKESKELKVLIYRKLPCSSPYHASARYSQFLEYLDRVPLRLQPVTHELQMSDHNQYVRVTTIAHPPKQDGYSFKVRPQKLFSNVENPAQILRSPTLILSPVSLVQSATAPCEMSDHLLFDSHGRPAFGCRVIHSAVLQLSCVQVINKAQRVVSVAYLIRENVLPKRGQVRKPDKCCTLDVQEGERAMLIRGSKDWGICIGKWQGVVKGVPGVPGVGGTKGTPGTSETPAIKGIPGTRGKPGTKGQRGSLSVKFFSLSEKQEWKRVEKCGNQFSLYLLGKRKKINVDLKTGAISFPAEVQDVPEAIALGFSIAILHLLCQPYYSPEGNNGCYTAPSVGENAQIEKPRRIHNEDLFNAKRQALASYQMACFPGLFHSIWPNIFLNF